MANRLTVHITVEPENGRGAPISLGRVSEGAILQLVARRVVDKELDRAERAGAVDLALGKTVAEEAKSLEVYFGGIIPGFAGSQGR